MAFIGVADGQAPRRSTSVRSLLNCIAGPAHFLIHDTGLTGWTLALLQIPEPASKAPAISTCQIRIGLRAKCPGITRTSPPDFSSIAIRGLAGSRRSGHGRDLALLRVKATWRPANRSEAAGDQVPDDPIGQDPGIISIPAKIMSVAHAHRPALALQRPRACG